MIHLDTNALIALPLWAREGHPVLMRIAAGEQAGALLARLDPAAYQTALDVAQAEFDAATAEFEWLFSALCFSQASRAGSPEAKPLQSQ